MSQELMTRLFGIIREALADRLLVWASMASLLFLVIWTTMRNPDPMRFVGSGLLIVVLAMVLYFSKKE
jgi:hypothetical protein